jgi:arsenate reductase
VEPVLVALADPTRLALCRLLADRELSVQELVTALGASQPLVSHHLKVLRDAGLIRSRRASYWTFYALDPDELGMVSGALAALAERARHRAAERPPPAYRALEPALRRWGMSESPGAGVEHETAGIVDRLASEFVGTFSRPTVERFLVDSLGHFAARGEVGALGPTEAFARERLRAAARAASEEPKTVPEVLFVCVKNAGRSQMALALLNHYARGAVMGRSAGSTPAWRIDANVEAALAEIGVDLAAEFPKPLTDEFVRSADVVVTMGCGDACPVYDGKTYLDWEIPDPADRPLEEVRAIREAIADRVKALLADIPLVSSKRA